MSELFYSITPEKIIQCLEEFSFEPTGHYIALNSFENRVYDMKLETGEHIVIKFYRPGRWSLEQIQEEHDFLLELKSQEIPVCAPLFLADNKTIHSAEGIFFAVWPRTGGRAADEFSEDHAEILGRLIAKIHNTGDSKISENRLVLSGESYALSPLKFLTDNQFIPPQYQNRYETAVKEIAEIYEFLSRDVPLHRIHGDCHPGNLLHGPEGWFFLDFDDFLTGPAVQDIWMLFPAKDSYGIHQREILLDSYRQFRDFNSSWLSLVEPLRALRYIHYTAWIARRWDDPAFPLAFPQFGTQSYWEECVNDLEDQLRIIHEGMEEGTPFYFKKQDEDPALTNEDYFWDLKDRQD